MTFIFRLLKNKQEIFFSNKDLNFPYQAPLKKKKQLVNLT